MDPNIESISTDPKSDEVEPPTAADAPDTDEEEDGAVGAPPNSPPSRPLDADDEEDDENRPAVWLDDCETSDIPAMEPASASMSLLDKADIPIFVIKDSKPGEKSSPETIFGL
jgi:hypothetical protein